MSDETPQPKFREHLHEMRQALAGIGKDVGHDVAHAPHLAKEGTKNALARAAGIRRTPIEEWSDPAPAEEM
jgi:predicted nuclease with TOPRIM domain